MSIYFDALCNGTYYNTTLVSKGMNTMFWSVVGVVLALLIGVLIGIKVGKWLWFEKPAKFDSNPSHW